MKLLKKIKRILLSRFRAPVEEDWIKERLLLCSTCPYNSKTKRISWVKKTLSDFYTAITFAEKKDLGFCAHEFCGCDLFFKSREPEEECPEDKWKSIYIPNKK